MATYRNTSPYYTTPQINGYLDVMTFRDIPAETDDILYEVTKDYENRPDRLAYDIYNDSNLWWVFSVRNKNILRDPIFDLKSGTKIYLPKMTNIKLALGI